MTRHTYEIPADCVVINAYETTFRVSSDHAMLDSGSGFVVEMWNRRTRRPEVHNVRTGWEMESYPIMPEPNATARDLELYNVYEAALNFIKDAHGRAEQALYIQQGRRVRVVKGRKCPKGEYEVVAHRQGDYGPYVNLRADDGKYYSYVAVSNVEVIPDNTAAFATPGYRAKHFDLPAMMGKTADEGFTPFAWGVLADWFEDHDLVAKAGGTAADFADAIRRITSAEDAPKFNNYFAECHNEFRRPFAGV